VAVRKLINIIEFMVGKLYGGKKEVTKNYVYKF